MRGGGMPASHGARRAPGATPTPALEQPSASSAGPNVTSRRTPAERPRSAAAGHRTTVTAPPPAFDARDTAPTRS